jgi:hypothetical protein
MPLLKSKPETPPAAVVEASCDILNLARLTMHPVIMPLMERRQGLQDKKATLLADQKQVDAVRQDYERVYALELAEEQPEIFRKWKELKQQLGDYEDQLALVETGLIQLDQQIDGNMGAVREQVQKEIDALFLPEVWKMIARLQDLIEANRQLHEIERCSARLLQTGNLALFNQGLEGWLFRLERKLALLVPK